MKKILRQQFGQSLLEAVFAIGILLLVAGAVLALTTANVVGQSASEFQITANNLAREAVEVVRNIRDSNWLAGNPWDQGLTDLISTTAIIVYNQGADSTVNPWQLQFNPTTAEKSVYLDTTTGLYSQLSAGGTFTGFKRELILDSICQKVSGPTIGTETVAGSCNTADEQKVGLSVTVTVSWVERNQNRQVKLTDLLYAWK